MRVTIHPKGRGFTLTDTLVACALVGILAVMILTAAGKTKPVINRVHCLGNLHQTGIGFINFAQEHGGLFPLDIPKATGGALEYRPQGLMLAPIPQPFLCLTNELSTPKILLCPSDSRQPALNFARFTSTNLSYFVSLRASPALADSVLAGDRNVVYGTNGGLTWNAELHNYAGNLLMADGHTEQTTLWTWPIQPRNKRSGLNGTTGRMSTAAKPGYNRLSEASSSTPSSDAGQPIEIDGLDQKTSGTISPVTASKVPPAEPQPAVSRPRLAVRLPHWAIMAGGLVALLALIIILLMIILKSMRDHRSRIV